MQRGSCGHARQCRKELNPTQYSCCTWPPCHLLSSQLSPESRALHRRHLGLLGTRAISMAIDELTVTKHKACDQVRAASPQGDLDVICIALGRFRADDMTTKLTQRRIDRIGKCSSVCLVKIQSERLQGHPRLSDESSTVLVCLAEIASEDSRATLTSAIASSTLASLTSGSLRLCS